MIGFMDSPARTWGPFDIEVLGSDGFGYGVHMCAAIEKVTPLAQAWPDARVAKSQ